MHANANDPFYNVQTQWSALKDSVGADIAESLASIYALASQLYADQCRSWPGVSLTVPFLVHPLRVARILAEEWGMTDVRTIATCLLHDAIKMGSLDAEQEIAQVAGKDVVDAVWIMTKPQLPEACPQDVLAARDARYFKVLRHAPAWVRLIKCADRIDNLRDAAHSNDVALWDRYSGETIGWHLYLARETLPKAELELFRAIVDGERQIRGRVPVWVDGHFVNPMAAELIPAAFAYKHRLVAIGWRKSAVVVATCHPLSTQVQDVLETMLQQKIEVIPVSEEAVGDALAACHFHLEDELNNDDRTFFSTES